jgi:DNA adenine methylase
MPVYRTPLRYPGGKQKLWPFIHEIIETNDLDGCDYIEPYAGGAGVAIELLHNKVVKRVHLNDSCRAVYAFWHSILTEPELFCRNVFTASLDIEEWRRQKAIMKAKATADLFDLGFSMFYLNRCNRSGIINAGVIGGLKQEGKYKIDARFPINDLISRIENIASMKENITVSNMDAYDYIKQCESLPAQKSILYCDPPYYNKADSLYPNYYKHNDHEKISSVIQSYKMPWVVSYDSCPEISSLYKERRQFTYGLQYNASKAYKGAELFIFSDAVKIPVKSRLPQIQEAIG